MKLLLLVHWRKFAGLRMEKGLVLNKNAGNAKREIFFGCKNPISHFKISIRRFSIDYSGFFLF